MARLEDAQQDLDTLTAQVAEADERLGALTATADEKTAELGARLEETLAQREPAAAGIPGDLLALYERLRIAKNGVAVGALRRRECGGCRLTLDPSELAAIRAAAPDEVVRHDECQRILVRTDESGL
nr:C4-type zinc ribbon domain-containing protein [Nocardioides anomalus]